MPRVARRRPSLVWVVPLVALAVAGWLVLREWQTRGPVITITFIDGAGVQPGRTILQHQGVAVGRVVSVELGEDLQHVRVRVRLDRSAAGLARDGALFWIVQPQISLSGIEGLDTLLSGAKLGVRPGNGNPQDSFIGLERPPPPFNLHAGRAFLLESERLNGLGTGTPIYYRDVKVGSVEECRLAEDARRVLIRVRIDTRYAHLVRPNTRFWISGGLSVRIGLRGAQFNASSLSSLISGGISFATPDTDANAAPASEGERFELFREPENEWLRWSPAIPIEPGPASTSPIASHVIGAE